MRKKNFQFFTLCVASSFLLLPSCVEVNDDYDLNKDIDMTLGVGGDLTLPTSSTVKMKMKDILDLEEDGIIQAVGEDKIYYLIEGADEPSTFEFDLPNIKVEKPKPVSFKLKFSVPDLKTLLNSFNLNLPQGVTVDMLVENTDMIGDLLPEELLNENHVSPELELEYGFDALKFDFTMPNEVLALDSIGFYPHLMPSFMLGTENMSAGKLVLHDVYAEFPGILNHNDITHGGTWRGELNEDGRHVYNLPKDILLVDGVNADFDMTFVGINLFDDGSDDCPWPWDRRKPEYNSGVFKIEENVAMHGFVTIEGTIIDFIELAGDECYLRADIQLSAPEIGEVRVIVDPEINPKSTSIELNDLPDFLTDNEVTVVLQQPAIRLDITASEKTTGEPLPVFVNCWGELNTDKGKTVNLSSVDAANIQIGGTVNSNWCIWDGVLPVWGDEYSYYQADGLTHIIEQIPNRIDIDFNASVVEDWISVKLGTSYRAVIDYNVECPLALASGSKIVYTETVDDLHKDIEDFDVKGLTVTAQLHVESPDGEENIPFDKLDLTVTPMDLNGNPMTNDIIITKLEGLDTDAKIEINLTSKEGALKKLNALTFEVAARVTENNAAPLSELTTIQLTNVCVGIVGGVIADLN